MITKDDVSLQVIKTKTKTGKDILKVFVVLKGFVTNKLVGFRSKKNESQWVVSEDSDSEDKKLFTFFENTVGKKKEYVMFKCPEFQLKDTKISIPLSGFLNNKYPVFDSYGNECITSSMIFDENSYEYYKDKVNDKYPKNYCLEDATIDYDKDTLSLVEDNCFKEFTPLKDTWFKHFFNKKEVETAGVGF